MSSLENTVQAFYYLSTLGVVGIVVAGHGTAAVLLDFAFTIMLMFLVAFIAASRLQRGKKLHLHSLPQSVLRMLCSCT